MPQQPRFTDIHCHLLPGIDDGAGDWSVSLTMAQIAVKDGIDCCVLTPHQLGEYTGTTGDQIRKLTSDFQTLLDQHAVPLRVLPGADVRIDSDMMQRLAEGDCLSLADARKHVLLELPHELYMPLEPVLSQLERTAMTGILSHPERNEGILARRDLIPPLVEAGCLMQITADSLKGAFGAAPQNFCHWMLENGYVHFIASDAHGVSRRRPTINKAYEIAVDLVGQEYAEAICCVNPSAVATGQTVPPLPRLREKSLFRRIFRMQAA